jgi:hypothetical protein
LQLAKDYPERDVEILFVNLLFGGWLSRLMMRGCGRSLRRPLLLIYLHRKLGEENGRDEAIRTIKE